MQSNKVSTPEPREARRDYGAKETALTGSNMEEQGLVQDRLPQKLRSSGVQDLKDLGEGCIPAPCKEFSKVDMLSFLLRELSLWCACPC